MKNFTCLPLYMSSLRLLGVRVRSYVFWWTLFVCWIKYFLRGIRGWDPPPLFVRVYLFMKGETFEGKIGTPKRSERIARTHWASQVIRTSTLWHSRKGILLQCSLIIRTHWALQITEMHCWQNIIYGNGGAKTVAGYRIATEGTTKRGGGEYMWGTNSS